MMKSKSGAITPYNFGHKVIYFAKRCSYRSGRMGLYVQTFPSRLCISPAYMCSHSREGRRDDRLFSVVDSAGTSISIFPLSVRPTHILLCFSSQVRRDKPTPNRSTWNCWKTRQSVRPSCLKRHTDSPAERVKDGGADF